MANGGFFEESPYGSTVYGGDGSGSSETPTTASVSLVAALGVIGTKYSWHSDIAYQGYSNGKGQCYGCLKFTLPSDAKSIVSASLTLHRKSNTGKGAEVDIFLYGSATAWGSKPTLSTKYNTSLDAVLAGRSTVLDVLAAAQALLAGTITQFVLYTGETTTLSGQVYSSNYCAWDEAVLSITYTT